MTMKFQMTRQGMQSLYSLAWRHGVVPEVQYSEDPMYSGYGAAEEEAPAGEAALLEETLVAPARPSPLEEMVRGEAYARRKVNRRELDLFWLGYSGV
jgi:hypothetical protein